MKVEWKTDDVSNHQKLRLTALLAEIGDTGDFDPVIPLDGGVFVYIFEKPVGLSDFDFIATPHPCFHRTGRPPMTYGNEAAIAITYEYRNANDLQCEAVDTFSGVLDHISHALLLTVLGGSEANCFIPSQIGMSDLQFYGQEEPDFLDTDHVWHSPVSILQISSGTPCKCLKTLLGDCRKAIKGGWDDAAAMTCLIDATCDGAA